MALCRDVEALPSAAEIADEACYLGDVASGLSSSGHSGRHENSLVIAGNEHSKVVIFVHGWTCGEFTWQEMNSSGKNRYPLLKSYRVITLDLPGHGRTDAPSDGKFTVDLFARAIESVRAEAKVNRVVFVGHSMGAPAVRQYARLYPQHTAALALVDGAIVRPDQIQSSGATARIPRGPNGSKFREQLILSIATFRPSGRKPIIRHGQ
jgi:pimeloyl-ACP methyl ester carboxylesterase